MAKDFHDGRLRQSGRDSGLSLRSQLFSHGFGFKTVVMVLRLDCPVHPDDDPEVRVRCRGLDSVGGVFDLELTFTPEAAEERDRLLKDFQKGSLFVVKGEYSIVTEDSSIILHNPIYYPVSLHFSEREIREVFRLNGIGLVRS